MLEPAGAVLVRAPGAPASPRRGSPRPPQPTSDARRFNDIIIIGIDAHTQRHSAAAIDDHGRVLGQIEVGAAPTELSRLIRWIDEFDAGRLVADEGAKGLGLALTRALLDASETVVDVPTRLTAQGRKSSRRRGKDDEADAITIARVALREPDLPRLAVEQLDADLKLLVDARDQLVAEATRVRNRLHALLLVVAPGYRETTGALNTKTALAKTKRIVTKARGSEPVRCKLALAAISRLHELDREIADLDTDLAAIESHQPTQLVAICGVGRIIAAKIIGETRGVERFPSAAALAAAHWHRSRSPPPAARPTGIASTAAATAT